jgi:hypothetical protein
MWEEMSYNRYTQTIADSSIDCVEYSRLRRTANNGIYMTYEDWFALDMADDEENEMTD